MGTTPNLDTAYTFELSGEWFAEDIHKRILDQTVDNDNTEVDPQFSKTLPMVERLGPLIVKALNAYWDEELRQAEAALATTFEPRSRPQTLVLAEYCHQPHELTENADADDFDGAVKSLKDIVRARRDTAYAEQGMKSWVWPLLQKYCLGTNLSKADEIGNEELLYMALDGKFPRGYGPYKYTQQDIEGYGLHYQRPTTQVMNNNKAAQRWRDRRRNYYQCLHWLRERGHSWVFMVTIKNLGSLFGQISDPESTLGPWIDLFGYFPD